MSWPAFYTRALGISVLKSSGTNDGITANKLVDSGATFQTDNVKIGDTVLNITDATKTKVTAIDSETQLSLAADIFPTPAGDTYEVGDYQWEITDAQPSDDYFDPHAILIGSGGTAGISDMRLTLKGTNNEVVLKLSNGVIHPISIKTVHNETTDGADIVILGNNK